MADHLNNSPSKFTAEDENSAKDLHLHDDQVPMQKNWEDGKKYVIKFTVRQKGRDTTMEDFKGSDYKILKVEGHSLDDELADRVRNSV